MTRKTIGRRVFAACFSALATTVSLPAVAGATATTAVRSAGAATAAARPAGAAIGRVSVDVKLANDRSSLCDLHLARIRLDHGQWVSTPPDLIPKGVTGVWKSESNAIFVGTDGSAEYLTGDCLDGRLNSRTVRVNWFISSFAATSYDAGGTDPAFRFDINGDSEEHATVRFTLRAA
ncbi:hypothetical protein [Nonomuraea aurantiaca]|uniref:hypothetical protein n=1 Tax=Nonomuraea aurantiaca TaxID=2878562 RepID=UPI001CD9A24F|nr:hypothetical protein [Nonomuraea aurantiaca]MCA2223249.1 hypothetical protein [Nonomuraea aurantiaca]